MIRFSCAAHTAQLLIEDISKDNEFFNNISKSVNYLIVWLRKRSVLKQIKSNNINAPPRFAQTRWNSIFICIEYIIKNFSSIENTIQFFEHTKHKCSLSLNENVKLQLLSLYNALKPVNNFTNQVQQNFVSAGDVYYYLIQFETEMTKITDPF